MNPAVVLRRTEMGSEELHTHGHGLERHLRTALILLNGSSSVAEICARNEGLPALTECIQTLVERGLAEPVPPAAPVSIDEVRQELIRIAQSVLGDHAGRVVLQFEAAAPTYEGLLETLERCRKMVLLVIDEHKAESLVRRCRAALGQAPSSAGSHPDPLARL